METAKVPTGILLQYGVEFIDLRMYNGQIITDTNKTSFAVVKQINSTLYSSRVTTTAANKVLPEDLRISNKDNVHSLQLMSLQHPFQ